MSLGWTVKSKSTTTATIQKSPWTSARKIHAVARQLVELSKHPSTLLDDANAKQMIIDGHSVKEIESHVKAAKTAEAVNALTTFGDAADKYKTEWVDKNWKDPDKGWTPPVRLHLLPKLAEMTL